MPPSPRPLAAPDRLDRTEPPHPVTSIGAGVEAPVASTDVNVTVADQVPAVRWEPGIVITPHSIELPLELAARCTVRSTLPMERRNVHVPSGSRVLGTIALAMTCREVLSQREFVMMTVTVFGADGPLDDPLADELGDALSVCVAVELGFAGVLIWAGLLAGVLVGLVERADGVPVVPLVQAVALLATRAAVARASVERNDSTTISLQSPP